MLILASKSPRRIELLKKVGFSFLIHPPQGEEVIPPGISPEGAVMELARKKAAEVFAHRPEDVVIGADTVVSFLGEIFGKPRDIPHACRMLASLGGNWHEVYTGICVMDKNKTICEYEKTRVKFKELTLKQIEDYIGRENPMDKAGAYAIQDRASLFAERIEGDFFNVVGLPLCHLGILLEEHFSIAPLG